MSWELYKLDDVCDVINGGSWTQDEYVSQGVKVIKVSNLVNDGIDESNMSYLPYESLLVYEKNILKSYDLVVTTVGSHPQLKASAAGRGFVISPVYEGSLLNQNTVCIRTKDENILFNRYLGYVGRSDDFRHFIQQTGRGAANQMRIPISNIKIYALSLPKLETQKRIASILSNYDDLIENNLNRIKLLEETAQNIYKEWFVNFRFPNYEHTEFDTESGLPVGWKKKSLNNFDCICQFKEKVKPYIGEKEYLATANVEGINISERGEYFTFENRPSRAQHLAPQESVWFARMSKTYKVILFTKTSNSDILLSSGFVGFIPKKSQFLPFLFCLINNKLFFDTKDMFCTGSTQVSLNNESINKLIYVEPNEEIITEFGNKVYPLIEQINKLFELNQKLKEARDILLPRLMNRTIEV
jgi:type I restriction enzyme S subunit